MGTFLSANSLPPSPAGWDAGVNVSAELYKLLVYDEGSFFKEHRDTEKADGMFGTLVIVLPSKHRGGELVIRHAGRETTIDLSGDEVSALAFAAFYADCEHEVRPITQGSRVCLTYNLIQRQGRKKGNPLTAPLYESEVTAASVLLDRALTSPDAPRKIAWLLEHQYSPAGLSFSALKNADSARAKVLSEAAARADCVVHLGIVHIEEYGSAELNYEPDFYGRSRWRQYDDDNDNEDEDEQDDASSEDFDIIEIDNVNHFVDEWVDLENRYVEFGPIPLEAGELVPEGALDGEQPDAQRVMEATGNEGASFERSYHRAALVVWHRDQGIRRQRERGPYGRRAVRGRSEHRRALLWPCERQYAEVSRQLHRAADPARHAPGFRVRKDHR